MSSIKGFHDNTMIGTDNFRVVLDAIRLCITYNSAGKRNKSLFMIPIFGKLHRITTQEVSKYWDNQVHILYPLAKLDRVYKRDLLSGRTTVEISVSDAKVLAIAVKLLNDVANDVIKSYQDTKNYKLVQNVLIGLSQVK